MIEISLLGTTKKSKSKIGKMPSVSFNLSFGTPNIFILSFVVIFVVEVVGISLMTLKMNNEIELLTQKRNKLRSIEKKVKTIKRQLKQINIKISTIKRLSQNRGRAYKILEEIANVMPTDGIWLTRFEKKGNTLTIEGKSFSTEAVAAYMTNLENIKGVQKVRFRGKGLVRMSKYRNLYGFDLIVTLKG